MVFEGTTEGLGGHPASLAAGGLQLPVHEFGVIGYPYSSTPIGAPGPGPHTVPSVVGPGPNQGTGTRGLDFAVTHSASTAPSLSARIERGVVGEIVGGFFIRKGETSAPPSL